MKKNIQVLFLWMGLCLLITGCGKASKNTEIEAKNVSFEVKEETLTNSQATFLLKNNQKQAIEYGEEYFIEKKQKKKWNQIEPIEDLYFNLPLYTLNPSEEKELEINWEHAYGKLSPGTYRIVKKVHVSSTDIKYVKATFTIPS